MRLCKLLHVERNDLYAVIKGRAGTIRGARVLDAIARVFPKLLAAA